MSRPSLVADKTFWIEYSEELEQQLADRTEEWSKYCGELKVELAELREAAQAEVDRQRHQCGILRQELPPTTAALAALLHGDGNE